MQEFVYIVLFTKYSNIQLPKYSNKKSHICFLLSVLQTFDLSTTFGICHNLHNLIYRFWRKIIRWNDKTIREQHCASETHLDVMYEMISDFLEQRAGFFVCRIEKTELPDLLIPLLYLLSVNAGKRRNASTKIEQEARNTCAEDGEGRERERESILTLSAAPRTPR